MSGALSALLAGIDVLLSVGVADQGFTVYGYVEGGAGTLAPTTFSDRDGTLQTVVAIVYNQTSGALTFTLEGGVDNDDGTFVAITIAGTRLTRSSATFVAPANSSWSWTVSDPGIGTSGTKFVTVNR